MSEYKPITGELRNSMTYDITTALDGVSTASIDISAFCDLCDAIDSVHAALEAEHEKAMIRAGQLLDDAEKERDYNYANWQECKQKVLQGNITFDELNARIEHLMDELSHCIELPKDADGVPISVGDMMESPSGCVEMVEGILPGRYLVLRNGDWFTCRADWGRHYHHDTWERIEDDATMPPGDYVHKRMTVAHGTIETVDEAFEAMACDLVARCKALAGDAE